MKERPILFSAPMVRAILDGTKTQTRRVVKPQPYQSEFEPDTLHINGLTKKGEFFSASTNIEEFIKRCPYGKVGDQLWVRETFNGTWCEEVIYKADGDSAKAAGYEKEPKWKPSIFMPRSFSRIQLEIIDIGIERLQDINEEDAISEGMSQAVADAIFNVDELSVFAASFILAPHATNRILFESLWEKINGADSWAQNPWVWVIEFKVV
jgi:hypothetical protein